MSIKLDSLLSSTLKDAWYKAVVGGPFFSRMASCEAEPKQEVKDAADDLDKIMSGEAGMMDREEMMEAMMAK